MSTTSTSNPTVVIPRETGSAQRPPRRGWLSLQSLPTVLVFLLLAGVFALGHVTGWKLPSSGELFGGAGAAPDDWCAEHLVPESACVECQTTLLPKPKPFGFCKLHGVAECVTCHPESAQVKGTPRLPAYDTQAALELIARPENNSRNTLHERRLQFATAEAATRAGVDVDVVREQPMVEAIEANGEITFDPTRVAHLGTRAPGSVAFAFKIVGDRVTQHDVLALVDVAQVGQAKSELLHAIVQRQLRKSNLDRLQSAGDGIAGKTLSEAKAAMEEAEVQLISARQALVNLGLEVPEHFEEGDARRVSDELRLLGIPPEILSQLPPGTKSANLYPVRAPFDGMIVAAESVVGEVVSAENVLFTVADPSRLWLTLSVRQEDARYVKPGLPVNFHTEDGGQQAQGTISWVSPGIDERTRTMQARVVLDNPTGVLKDRTFGSGRIVLRTEPKSIVVPRESVQTTGDASFVFVRDRDYLKEGAPKVFHVRQVRTGARDDQAVELLAGVLPGEVVAKQGSAALMAQLLRNNLGAGCGCHEK